MLIDLTLRIPDDIKAFPGFDGPTITQMTTIEQEGWNVRHLSMDTHCGTHVDAPFHMLAEGKKLEAYAPSDLVGEARVLELSGIKKIEPRHIPHDLTAPILLLKTGYTARSEREDSFECNPVLTEDAAHAIVQQGVKIVGIDSFTVDDEPYEVHRILFRHNILIVENLIHLEKLGECCKLIIAPLRLTDADGAPARVFAEI